MEGRPYTRLDPRARGSRWDDIRWGSSEVHRVVVPPGGGAVVFQTDGTLVDWNMWPARAVSLLAAMTPLTGPSFAAAAINFDVVWTVSLGVGSAKVDLTFAQAFAPPFANLVLGAGAGFPDLIPAKHVWVTVVATSAAPMPAGEYAVRFAAFVAPVSLGGLGVEGDGGSEG